MKKILAVMMVILVMCSFVPNCVLAANNSLTYDEIATLDYNKDGSINVVDFVTLKSEILSGNSYVNVFTLVRLLNYFVVENETKLNEPPLPLPPAVSMCDLTNCSREEVNHIMIELHSNTFDFGLEEINDETVTIYAKNDTEEVYLIIPRIKSRDELNLVYIKTDEFEVLESSNGKPVILIKEN